MAFFSGFPFGGMRGGFGDDDDDSADSGPIDNSKFYDILGVSKKASQAEIKKAFLELAKKNHPDKGGSAQKFNQIKHAYEVLNDPDKRQIYDKYGTKGLNRGSGGSQQDILNMFFGGGRSGGSRQRQMPKVKPMKKKLDITLEDAYNGCVKKIPVKRSRCCEVCQGKGGSGTQTCKDCKGRGVTVRTVQMGPMIQQFQQHCSSCKGEGTTIEEKNKCKSCKGEKTLEKQKILEVSVEKGTPNEHVITLPGEGDELPDCLAGDVIFVVAIKNHPIFTRVGADLFFRKKVSLLDALTGFSFDIKHLDGSNQHISTISNDVISDQEKKVLRGLGMPFFKDSLNFGNLIVEIDVVMPPKGSLGKEQIEALMKVLGGQVNPRPTDDKYDLLEDFNPHETNTSEEGGHKEEEQDDEPQGQRVQCSSQ